MYTASDFISDMLRIFTASQLKYIKPYKDGSYSFNISKRGITFHVVKVNEDRFTVIQFRTAGEVFKEFKKNQNKYIDAVPYVKQYVDSSSFDNSLKWWIKKEMGIKYTPPSYFYTNDVLINLWVKKAYQLTKRQLFDLLVAKNKLPMDYFEDYYGKMEEGEDISDRIKHFDYGKWSIYLDVDTKRSIDEVQQLLDDVSKELNKKGYGNLCYGKIFVIDSMGDRSFADYNPNKDDIRIAFKMMKKKSRIDQRISLTHEIGHRNFYKFLNSKQRAEISSKYFTEVKLSSPKNSPKAGDVIVSKTFGDRYMVKRVEYKRSLKYVVSLVELGEHTRNKSKDLFQLYQLDDKFMGVEYLVEGKSSGENTYVPRAYGLTNEEEFYAVLWEAYIQGTLKDPAKAWFENLEK